jgi:hypothetical protein
MKIKDLMNDMADFADERALNNHLIDALIDGTLSREDYIEYLEITQGDVFEDLETYWFLDK